MTRQLPLRPKIPSTTMALISLALEGSQQALAKLGQDEILTFKNATITVSGGIVEDPLGRLEPGEYILVDNTLAVTTKYAPAGQNSLRFEWAR